MNRAERRGRAAGMENGIAVELIAKCTGLSGGDIGKL